VIEVNQVGNLTNLDGTTTGKLFYHQEPNSYKQQQEIKDALLAAIAYSQDLNLYSASPDNPGIPPSSLMSFIASRPSTAGVVLAEFDQHFTNKYYKSRFDKTVDFKGICKVANFLAQTIYQLAKNSTAPSLSFAVNCTQGSFAEQLVYCLTQDIGCNLARSYFHAESKNYETQPTAYSGVYRSNSIISESAIFMYNALTSVMGNSFSLNCQSDKDCAGSGICVVDTCYDTEIYWHDALSLAFDLQDGFPVPNWNNWQKESTWTESRWEYPTIQVFNMDNPIVEIVTFVCGLLEIIASFVGVWLLKRYFQKRYA